jgi:hypothetical protein
MERTTQEYPVVPADEPHLQNTEKLYGHKLVALDGDIGHLRDFYFDDNIWVIRYAIADTGTWLTGRLVLLSPHAFGKLDQGEKTLHINLKKAQIQDSPPIESHKPVSRQDEAEYYRYYGWPAYWAGDAMWGIGSYPVIVPPAEGEIEERRSYYHRDDKHLQSARDIAGYPIQATDGELGHVKGFLVDDRSWAIRELIIEAGHWYSGKEIRMATDKVTWISYNECKVHVSLTKADIQRTAEHELATVGAAARGETQAHV